ncbi:MAG: type IX secretion system sortase PorU [Duncaniella sp.]|nr:type IX secretion system sortase PorU [Muribaculum sp.]MCM1254642.1 type IX secretion system sortase PorU [Duncaniella sp.]
MLAVSTLSAWAFGVDSYAQKSALSSGRWVKISVVKTGLYLISNSELRKWGFTTPESVGVFGYGGRRIPDILTLQNYVDDLPRVQSELTDKGIVFYAVGPELNPYSIKGYYFLTETDIGGRPIPVDGITELDEKSLDNKFEERIYHELEMVSPAESGHQLLGEDFRFTPSRTLDFKLTNRVEGTDVGVDAVFYAKTVSGPATWMLSANGATISGSERAMTSHSDYGDTCRIHCRFPVFGANLALGMRLSVSGTVTLAHLDNIAITYTRSLTLPDDKLLSFSTSSSSLRLKGASTDTRIWDVTHPRSIVKMNTASVSDGVGWKNPNYGIRSYVAWNEDANFFTPDYAGQVLNQNIHGEEVPNMVIVTHPQLLSEAERVARLHEDVDGMSVIVVTMDEVANEFGSGVADVNAIRKMMKMFYDRDKASATRGKLQHLLLIGSVTHDHRRLTEAIRQSRDTSLPTWQSDMCISENSSFCSDDPMCFLADGSGIMAGGEEMEVTVGRIPAHNLTEAKNYVDRLVAYVTVAPAGEWRNKILLLADDGDNGLHLRQSDQLECAIRGEDNRDESLHESFLFKKVYIDTYELRDGVYQEAREKLYRLLDEGVVWWNYIGHANINSFTSEGIFTSTDLARLYLRRPPVFMGATCDFGKWDGVAVSGLEQLVMRESGGVIAGISAVRKVLMARNGMLTSALGRELSSRDGEGRIRPIGELLRRAKNQIRDDNKLRYVLLGDPAMRLAVPELRIQLDSVDGEAADGEAQIVINGMHIAELCGSVRDVGGGKVGLFNGMMDISVYDAERSYITKGNGADGDEVVYDEQGDRLFAGRTMVVNGEFKISVPIPGEISNNFRNAAMSMYALSEDGCMEAAGVNRNFYIYGLDEGASMDSVAPVIEYIYLNHESFRQGDKVNDEPMLLARVSDNVGINMSAGGVGRAMSLTIDSDKVFTDLVPSYYPDDRGVPAGEIRYRMPELTSGYHSAKLKVWDVGGNSAEAEVEFFVDPQQAPKIFDVHTDANPVSVEANFYVVHNRPDAMLKVRIEVYDIAGNRVWHSESQGKSEMYVASPVKWNLAGNNGARVPAGIYVYCVTVTAESVAEGETKSSSMSKKLAVVAEK